MYGLKSNTNNAQLAANYATPSYCISPDAKNIIFAGVGRGGADIYEYDLMTNNIKTLLQTDDVEYWPSISPDGKKIVFCAKPKGSSAWRLRTLELKTGIVATLTNSNDASDSYPQYSPNGKQIIFTRGTRLRGYVFGGEIWNDVDVCEIDNDGSNFRQLSSLKYYSADPPVPISNGDIYFSARLPYPSTSNDLYKIVHNVNSNPVMVGPPTTIASGSLAPDGKTFLAIAPTDGKFKYEIEEFTFLSAPQSVRVNKVFNSRSYSSYPMSPKYSPGKRFIYFLGDPNSFDKPDLMKLDSLTGKITKVISYSRFLNPLGNSSK